MRRSLLLELMVANAVLLPLYVCALFFIFIKSLIQTMSLNGNRFSSVLILWNRLAERDNCDARRNHFRGIDL